MSNSKPAAALPISFQEIKETQDFKDLVSTLPTENDNFYSQIYKYQAFWHFAASLQGTLNFQNHFYAHDSDILLISTPKSGTTWLKAIAYALIHRHEQFPVSAANVDHHPLTTKNPHELVPSLEFDLFSDHSRIPDISTLPSPRLLSSHLPIVSLPQSVHDSHCKLVYICREPKDAFISLWHHSNKIGSSFGKPIPLEECFDLFCKGRVFAGPFWDHMLGYWNASLEKPDKVLFVRYEELKESPSVALKRIAEFLGFPISVEEEEAGIVQGILELCSFCNLSNLAVNKTGRLPNGLANDGFFRKGKVGDWANYLTPEMVAKIDQITGQKFYGTGLKF